MLTLETPIEQLSKVGSRALPRLHRLGIKTVRDLLWHFPARYADFSQITPIEDIHEKGQMVSIIAQVRSIKVTPIFRRRRMTIISAEVEDDTGSLRVTWFNQPYIADQLPEGTYVSLSGKIGHDKRGLYLSAPQFENVEGMGGLPPHSYMSGGGEVRELKHTGRLVPVYPETQGITSKYLRFLIKPLLDYFDDIPTPKFSDENFGGLADPLPKDIMERYAFPNVKEALSSIHFPHDIEHTERARKRFAFEELLLFQLRALMDRARMHKIKAPVIQFDKKLIADFVTTLPFKLTDDQRVAAFEILKDLERGYPMNRLLNGDVGAGKTVVALIGAYQAAQTDWQTVIMAPTEILAKQHYQTMKTLLPEGIRIGLLTGAQAKQWPIDEITEEKISKKLMHTKIANGEIDIIIGTHAVISKGVAFAKLGLVVIDEQHRFGIDQRAKLVRKQKTVPHLLSMTATPIPRTLALTIWGDLDVSLIVQKPSGRKPIITKTIADKGRDKAHAFIDQQIEAGRQVFVICPRIEISKSEENPSKKVSQTKLMWAEVKAVEEEFEKLSKKVFTHRRVVMLHGKMKPKEKEQIMKDFRDHKYDIVVSTSVIEVGVDVPNATIMMIESAERFGLAQLHQFRGRVGRGEHQSYCFLFTTSGTEAVSKRLKSMEKTNDGFKLAQMDLEIRGPGEFTGVKQSGMPDLTMSSLTDMELIKKTREEAQTLLKKDSQLKKNPALLAELEKMQRVVHFE